MATLLAAAVAGPALGAAEADPLKSEACRVALEKLEQVAGQPASPQRAARLAQARESAATACLGRGQERGVRSGAPYPAQPVAPPVTSMPRPHALPAPVAVPPATPPPRPAVVTTCDPAGCWDSDGRRLNQVGPQLMGPRGPCTLHGGIANCP